MNQADSTPEREPATALGLLLLSAAILLLEIGQVRVFSFILWHHVTYLVVTVTLLGFAAGGTWLAVARAKPPIGRAAFATVMFATLVLATFGVLARHEIRALPEVDSRWPAIKATLAYLYLVVPFFFGGVAVAAALDGTGARVSRRYSVNLIGSALGCLLVVPTLRAVGGAGLVLVSTAIAACAGASFAYAARRTALAGCAVLVAIASLAALPKRDQLLPFPVAEGKTLHAELHQAKAPLAASVWDPICRIDVVGDETKDTQLRVYQDGDAPTRIPSTDKEQRFNLPSNHMALAYTSTSKPKGSHALVIGVGGGFDLAVALEMGATRVLGAEINPSTAELMRGRFAAYTGGLYNDPRVEIVVADGRSVVARTKETFDVIQITGADTYAALATGANLTAESYLYTQDAIRDYVDHLNDDGVLAVLRWRFYPPREELRLIGMMARELRRRGVANPSAHLAVVDVKTPGEDGGGDEARYAVSLLKKSPFKPNEIEFLERFCAMHPDKGKYSMALVPGGTGEAAFADYVNAIGAGPEAEAAFEDAYAYAVGEVTDDRPFFFQFYRGRDVLASGEEQGARSVFHSVIGHGPAGLQVLWLSLAAAVVLLLVLVVVPLVAFRSGGLRVAGAGRQVLFFAAVGLAFMCVEIPMIQRLTLYLGHPLEALGLGISAFLVFSGLGAATSARVGIGSERAAVTRAALVVVLLSVLVALFAPRVFAATLDLGLMARRMIAVVVIAPAAFAMGFPFPLGLRFAKERAAPLLPWAFGVNGGASVIASVLTILVAMDHGFTHVLLLGAALYALAAFALPRARV